MDGEMEWRRRKEKSQCKRREMGENEGEPNERGGIGIEGNKSPVENASIVEILSICFFYT